MNVYLIVILAILIGEYALESIVGFLNMRCAHGMLPQEFEGFYDADKYRKSQDYLKVNTRFDFLQGGAVTAFIVIFILLGGFDCIDRFARGFDLNLILTGLIFAGILLIGSKLLHIPFEAYHTFVIESRYGFNQTTVRTFITDIVKSLVITLIIAGIAFSGVVWFFAKMPQKAWFYCWIALSLFELFIIFIAPALIMPLFNRFTPLPQGRLKEEIEAYARSQRFILKGIFTMDASRRSSKSNAFFTGFGRYRRIVLFDTLIKQHSTEELVSVLAHEIGHYKRKHILKGVMLSIVTTGIMLFILSFFIHNRGLFDAFKMEHVSIYGSLVFFGFLYAPLNTVFSVVANVLSRKHEYQADRFAVTTYANPQAFITALKKLTVANLTNLTPHPFKVFLDYSHPPVLARIRAIEKWLSADGAYKQA